VDYSKIKTFAIRSRAGLRVSRNSIGYADSSLSHDSVFSYGISRNPLIGIIYELDTSCSLVQDRVRHANLFCRDASITSYADARLCAIRGDSRPLISSKKNPLRWRIDTNIKRRVQIRRICLFANLI